MRIEDLVFKVASAVKTCKTSHQDMTILNLFTTTLCVAALANIALGNWQPWLDTSLNHEERLQLFISQLNTTQKLAMTQGDTEVISQLNSHTILT